MNFNPHRLTLARKRRGLSKTKLASLINLTPKALTDFEAGMYEPSAETLQSLATELEFPESFFAADDIRPPAVEDVSFRARTKMTAAKRDMALAAGAFAFQLNDWVEKHFELPAPALPDLREYDPESAAKILRRDWKLGDKSIPNMIHLLESKGIRVYTLVEETTDVDAFSVWHDGKPFVFLNTRKSAERSRFDAAHELGHLVLHCSCPGHSGKLIEREADMFASAFLMPDSKVMECSGVTPSVSNIVHLKKRWLVSAMALAYRLKQLGLITDWQHRSLCINLPRDREPDPAQRESSKLWAQIFAQLQADGVTRAVIAKELCLPVKELDKLIFGLALVGLRGSQGANAPSRNNRPDLRLL